MLHRALTITQFLTSTSLAVHWKTHCDEGTLWDPTLAAYEYSYANTSNTFTPYSGSASPNWLYFEGHWGDAQLPDNASGQVDIFGYVGGPAGPIDKVLDRTAVCPDANNCIVRPI